MGKIKELIYDQKQKENEILDATYQEQVAYEKFLKNSDKKELLN